MRRLSATVIPWSLHEHFVSTGLRPTMDVNAETKSWIDALGRPLGYLSFIILRFEAVLLRWGDHCDAGTTDHFPTQKETMF